jgi:hypothetical protein
MAAKKLTTEGFIKRAKAVHGDTYDYNETVFINWKTKVRIYDPIYGFFETLPFNHLRGHENKSRASSKYGVSIRSTTTTFIKNARSIHGDTYGYDQTDYQKSNVKVKIYCKIHGEYFLQTPNKHLCGSGCPKCGIVKTAKQLSILKKGVISPTRLGTTKFIKRSQEIHGDTYDYSLVDYITSKDDVTIICKTHGSFTQKPHKHLMGRGCPHCPKSRQYSIIANKWLDSLEMDLIREYRIPEKRTRSVDAYDPVNRVCYNFHGSYFHGDPEVFSPDTYNKLLKKTHGELYQRTLELDQELRDFGYEVIVMWESEYKQLLKEEKNR